VGFSSFSVASVGEDGGDQAMTRCRFDSSVIIGGNAQSDPSLHKRLVPVTGRQQCGAQLPVGAGKLDRYEASLGECDHSPKVGETRLDLPARIERLMKVISTISTSGMASGKIHTDLVRKTILARSGIEGPVLLLESVGTFDTSSLFMDSFR
jgi:hypothetical protein